MVKRELKDLPIGLVLHESVKRGGGSVGGWTSELLPNWRRSIRRVGGYWAGTTTWEGPRSDLEEMFLFGMMRELRESMGDVLTWQGFLGKIKLYRNGLVFTRSLIDRANMVRAIYSRIYPNVLTNGSGESGAWAAVGTPTTLAQYSGWFTHGTVSIRIVTDAADEGAVIQTGLTVTNNKPYDFQCSVNIISGTWKLQAYRTDNGDSLGSTSEGSAGEKTLQGHISDTNAYAGSSVGLRLICTSATGQIYADDAQFRDGTHRAETSWYQNTESQKDYGQMQTVLLEGGLSDEAALALVQTYLRDRAWPKTELQDEIRFGDTTVRPADEAEIYPIDRLDLSFYGYAWTLRNRIVQNPSTNTVSAHLASLIAASEFITAGKMDTNATNYTIDSRAPLNAWEVIEDMVRVGDSTGQRYSAGVYANRRFQYHLLETTPNVHISDGKFLHPASGDLEGYLAQPGLAYILDFPDTPGAVSGNIHDDPRYPVIDEIEFDVRDWVDGNDGLRYRKANVANGGNASV